MSTQLWYWGYPSYIDGRRAGPDVRVRCVRAEPREWYHENGDLVKGAFYLTRECTEGEDYKKPKKGSFVDLTYRGESVIGKVVRVRKRDGMVTVDVRETTKPHSDEDVAWLDMHPADIHVR